MTVTSKEVRAALETNPAYADVTLDELRETHEETGRHSGRYEQNAETMKEMGLDFDECVEGLSDEVAKGWVLTSLETGDPVSSAASLFFWGLQIGFQLGRGYIEED